MRKGVYPGVNIPIAPDDVDALDAGDVVEGFGLQALRRVRRVRRVGGGF